MNSGTLRIAFVTKRPCIRVAKEAFALYGLGHEISLISPVMDTDFPYKHVAYWKDAKGLADQIKLFGKTIDVFVVHNEPTWPISIIRETLPNAKIVLDYHDSLYWYMDPVEPISPFESVNWYEEDYCVSMCDGFVVPSDNCKKELKSRKNVNGPITVLPPAAIMNDYRYQSHNFMGGLASQGGHAVPGKYSRTAEHWRDYTKLYKYLYGKCAVHVYTPNYEQGNACHEHYSKIISTIGKLYYDEMLNAIGRHSWNLVGNWINHYVWQFSAPNKFYDALAAGTPSVIFNTESIMDDVIKDDIGIVVTHPDELLARWDEHSKKRVNVMLKRKKYCMERFIGRAVDLYRKVING